MIYSWTDMTCVVNTEIELIAWFITNQSTGKSVALSFAVIT